MLLGQVGEVEVDGERMRDGLRALQRPGGDQGRDLASGIIPRIGTPRRDDQVPEMLHVIEQVLAAGLAEHIAEHATEQPDIAAHAKRIVTFRDGNIV